ncbi:cyclic nucleotide-binding domain-containing protein [Clostridium cochlearium]|uniref:cyclic nucleotide-binding domain-containing protein n=1 Tax=Clostridium cochlearium TaxID=1494 RepID=UPI000B94BA42|nr:cyclic nucleotide-binding domain-containing protein [Clostridium cochlearium]SNV77276.1 cNMP-binding regulatory protein [Clostridium cochlearium]STA92649.1 cNMP-binding regulatory protein [Clostridium cochlearium]
MKKISDRNIIMEYIQKYQLDKIFKANILEHMELSSFQNGELICSKDNELKHMFFLVEGKIKTYTLHEDGKSILLRFSYPLSILGDVELLTNYKVLCNVESINESIFIAIEMEKLRKYACEDTVFLKFIIDNLSRKLYSSTNATSINLLYSLESRLASYILSMNDYEDNLSEHMEIKIPKLIEIAPLLGTSYRHLNRILNEFINKNIIQKRKSTIIIKNLEKLKELSQGNIYEK